MNPISELEKDLNDIKERESIFNDFIKPYKNRGLYNIHKTYTKGSDAAKKRSAKSAKTRKDPAGRAIREAERKKRVKDNRSAGAKKGWETRHAKKRNVERKETLKTAVNDIMKKKIEEELNDNKKAKLEEQQKKIIGMIEDLFGKLNEGNIDRERRIFYNETGTLAAIQSYIILDLELKGGKNLRGDLSGNIIDILDKSYNSNREVSFEDLKKKNDLNEAQIKAAVDAMFKDENSPTFEFFGDYYYESNYDIFAIALYERYKDQVEKDYDIDENTFRLLIKYCLTQESWVFYGERKQVEDVGGKVKRKRTKKGEKRKEPITPKEALEKLLDVYEKKFKLLYKGGN